MEFTINQIFWLIRKFSFFSLFHWLASNYFVYLCPFVFLRIFVYMCAGLNLYNELNFLINTTIFFFFEFFHWLASNYSTYLCFLANIRTHVRRFKSITICYETALAVSLVWFNFDGACSSNLCLRMCVCVNFFLSNQVHIPYCCLSRPNAQA